MIGDIKDLIELLSQLNPLQSWLLLGVLFAAVLLFRKWGQPALEKWRKKTNEREARNKQIKTNADELNVLKAQYKKHETEIDALKSRLDDACIKADNLEKQHIHDIEIIEDKALKRKEQSLDIQQKLNGQIDAVVIALKEQLADKINEKYKYYISIKGIPEDEVEEFASLHKAYKGLGGNSYGDAKYDYCVNHLPVLPVETRLKITHNEER